MRITVDLEDDVLEAIEQIASTGGRSVGHVLSELARRALEAHEAPPVRNGVTLLPRRQADSPKPTMALVNRLRDEP
jgi:hypothetical protein